MNILSEVCVIRKVQDNEIPILSVFWTRKKTNMENKTEFNLADGEYQTADAQKLLLELINGKMNYQNLKVMKSLESEDGSFESSNESLNELKRMKQQVSALLLQMKGQGLKVQLKCNLEIAVQEEVLCEV